MAAVAGAEAAGAGGAAAAKSLTVEASPRRKAGWKDAMGRAIWVCSLHPTRDVIMDLPRLKAGDVNRASRWFSYPGGKALNAARTIGTLGGRVRAFLVAPSSWRAELREFLAPFRVPFRMIAVPGEGRICVMVNERCRETVINTDLAMRFDAARFRTICRELKRIARRARYVVFSGSPPPTLGLRRVRGLFRLAAAHAPLVIDQARGYLKAAVRLKPWLIKPNLREFHQLMGRKTCSFAGLLEAVEEARARGARRVLLSLGEKGCMFAGPEGRWFAPPLPTAGAGLSPLGSGDALLGGFLYAAADGAEGPEALKWGVAAGTANLFRPGACFMSASEVGRLFRRVRTRRV